jgi:hypothetical protein
LFNVLGEKIETLFEGTKEAGKYKIIFSSAELPSGNYIYTIEMGSHRMIKKMTILK